MNLLSLFQIEFMKLKRSRIIVIFIIGTIVAWGPSILNADMNFHMEVEGILPENNFFIQGFLAFSWFLFPAIMVVCTVLLGQVEKSNRGMLKMSSLPVSLKKMCIIKLGVLYLLGLLEVILGTIGYYIAAIVAGMIQNYTFALSPLFIIKEAGYFYLSVIPMITFFWMITVLLNKPVFSVGFLLVTIVPSVLLINTKYWLLDPVCYPFYFMTSEYGNLAENVGKLNVPIVTWLLIATAFVLIFMMIAQLRYSRTECE